MWKHKQTCVVGVCYQKRGGEIRGGNDEREAAVADEAVVATFSRAVGVGEAEEAAENHAVETRRQRDAGLEVVAAAGSL